ncbi:MAG TPA: CocE/NonD family hydrolase [Acidimicrobiales bacterium]|nr:CocE/NonD family hydrolase [Acidimicrobiales bacterium]
MSTPVCSRTKRATAALAALTVLVGAAACTSAGSSDDLGKAQFATTGSVAQVFVTDAPKGATLQLRHGDDVVQTHRADAHGSLVFRDVKPGPDYRVRSGASESPPVTVLTERAAPPDTKIYDQKIPTGWNAKGEKLKDGGYGYLTVRDGTKVAINVHPGGPESGGPYPTVIEYSGYAYAKPGAGDSSIAAVWNALGYTVVDVNMRGTGCSGGAFSFFERNQVLDGYDVIETVARQPWALNGKVGMVGISYGGISQLFVAQTNPPHLAAITPASVLEGVTTTLYPGGMLNTGFALSWAAERDDQAKPASATAGQPWAWERIQAGDTTCEANQKLHSQAVNLVDEIHDTSTYVPSIVDPLTPSTFVDEIEVPTYLTCQFTDEQTGGYCPFLADAFADETDFKATFTNGTHVDSLGPVQIQHAFDLLEIHVAERAPDQTVLKAFGPAIYASQMDVPGVEMPDDPIADASSLDEARRLYGDMPRVQVLFDTGHGSATPGAPVAAFSHGFTGLDDPSITATPYYFGADGSLGMAEPTDASSVSFIWDPGARPEFSMDADDISDVWKADPAYAWKPLVDSKAVAFVSAPLADDVTVFGGGSVEAWVRSSATDTDLQATISEVRPDGQELFVQNGWLRASYRKLDAERSTPLQPVLSARKSDLAPLPADKWTRVHIPLYVQGHVYRAGSQIRVSIEAPGGDQPQWGFETLKPDGKVVDSIAIAPQMASRVLLPVVEGLNVPTPLPSGCTGMRGQPCRTYEAFTNTVGPKVPG